MPARARRQVVESPGLGPAAAAALVDADLAGQHPRRDAHVDETLRVAVAARQSDAAAPAMSSSNDCRRTTAADVPAASSSGPSTEQTTAGRIPVSLAAMARIV